MCAQSSSDQRIHHNHNITEQLEVRQFLYLVIYICHSRYLVTVCKIDYDELVMELNMVYIW